VAINKKYAGSFDRAKDEREFMDEIWLQSGIDAYRGHRMREVVGLSRLDVIAWYFAENPDITRWVDRNIEAGTCTDAVAELRAKREEFRRWRQEQREGMPRPERNPDFAWMDDFRMKPIVIPAPPAPAKNVVKPQPTNPAVRQWMRDRGRFLAGRQVSAV
jgi:hypothetical protein